jgi:hypothetical protein
MTLHAIAFCSCWFVAEAWAQTAKRSAAKFRRPHHALSKSLVKRDVMSSTHRLGRQSLLVKRYICARCKQRPLSTSIWQPTPRLFRSVLLPTVPRTERRNAGTKLRKSIEELPQGLQLPLEPFVEKEPSKYSPLIDEVLDNQRRFPKCVLLTRVGQFYEVRYSLDLGANISCTSNKRMRSHHC